jgi:hypothetical protein
MPPGERPAAELAELDRALATLGSPLPPGSTLLRAERQLDGLAGADAVEYAARLRDYRYRHPQAAPPGVEARRALRRALLGAAGWRSVVRVLRAVPPGGPSPRTGRADPTTSPWGRRPHPPSAAAGGASG